MKRWQDRILTVIGTSFGLGYCPVAPGTAGALPGVAVYWAIAALAPSGLQPCLIALALDVVQFSTNIKDISDNPDVLYQALKAESAGLIIQRLVLDYRPRLARIKKLALQQGDIRDRRKKKNRPVKGGPLRREGSSLGKEPRD